MHLSECKKPIYFPACWREYRFISGHWECVFSECTSTAQWPSACNLPRGASCICQEVKLGLILVYPMVYPKSVMQKYCIIFSRSVQFPQSVQNVPKQSNLCRLIGLSCSCKSGTYGVEITHLGHKVQINQGTGCCCTSGFQISKMTSRLGNFICWDSEERNKKAR